MPKNIFAIFCCLLLGGCSTTLPIDPIVGDGQEAGEKKGLTINRVQYPFRWCPAGMFMMGSPEDELGKYLYETQHQVTLTQGFWMLETEVTQEMWRSVMGNNPSKFVGSRKPVESVSWDNCQEYIQKLNALDVAPAGYKFSLPTDAQWEYACRAGTTTALNNGKNLTDGDEACPNLDEVSWYRKNSDLRTHPVGQKKANAWGLHDMHGNIAEWCLDWYGDYSSDSVTDPVGPTTSSVRVLRGGYKDGDAWTCRSARRSNCIPTYGDSGLGLRLALVREK